MPTASNAELQYETAQTSVALAALTNSGDNTVYTSPASLWSKKTGFKAFVRPNGVVTGCVVTPAASGTNDAVDISAGTAYIQGVLTTINAATDVTASRGVTTDTHRITSITITSLGAIAAVAGTDNAGSFSETRAADGGPPLIAADSIELAQVRTTSVTAAAITAAEIFATVGTHRETYNQPGWTENPESGRITMNAALPLIHTGPATKKVYASYATPSFLALEKATDFVPPENSYTVTSTQIYRNQTIGARSQTLNQGSFTAYFNDGVLDDLVANEGAELWFKFFPDRTLDQHILCNGALGITRSFPAADNISAACTISAETAAINKAA